MVLSLKAFVEKTEADLGIFSSFIEAHLGVALQIVQDMDNALENPIVDGVLLVVLPPLVTSHIPQAEALLEKAIVDLTIGTAIQQDMAAATTPEAKLKIFLQDLQKYNAFLKHALLEKILSLLLAGLDNNALTEVLYDTYAQAGYALKKK